MFVSKKENFREQSTYANFTAEDLLNDAFFLECMKHPTTETEKYWQEVVGQSFVLQQDISLAKNILSALSLNKKEMGASEFSLLRERILKSNKETQKTRKLLILKRMAVAASIFLAFFSSYYYLFYDKQDPGQSIVEIASLLRPAEAPENITILRNTSQDIVVPDQNVEIEYTQSGDIKINSELINNEESDQALIEYNQLIVPVGKRSSISLPDGTTLWLNSGSRLIYPSVFAKNKREVYLDGEMFLSVAPDKDRPFIVATNKIEIEVLGTMFNITAYEQDKEQSVVLVSGAVSVKGKGKEEIRMKPNERLLVSDDKSSLTVVNTSFYTSWKDGRYMYESEKLGVILDKLSRYYGKEIYYDETVKSLLCSGSLNLKEDFISIIKGMQKVIPFEYHESKGKIIIQMSNQ